MRKSRAHALINIKYKCTQVNSRNLYKMAVFTNFKLMSTLLYLLSEWVK